MSQNRDVYQIVTDQIVSKLEQGTVPWHQPWVGTPSPKNLISGNEYRGINVFLLHGQDYVQPYWLTFNQVKSLGGNVKKGERGSLVVFTKWIEEDLEETEGESKATTKKYGILRYYKVFNVQQCESIDHKVPPLADLVGPDDPIETAAETVSNMPYPPVIQHERSKAYYSAKNDVVNLPPRGRFDSAQEYYATLFHELVHSTGHESRLARKGVMETGFFGSESYSKEELIAELGAAYLSWHAGIERKTIDNNVAYIRGWIQRLKNDRRLITIASGQAQKAVDYILARNSTGKG